MADPQTVIEGTLKYRDNKKWKPRWCVIRKLSPVADCLHLQLYRDSKDRCKNGPTKASLSLEGFLGMETGFTLDKESNTMALICSEVVVVLAFDSRELLIQWQVKVRANLVEEHQFLVQISHVPTRSKLSSGPARLHLLDYTFCLTAGVPPKLLGIWPLKELRRFGVVDGKFCFEGGSRCGKGEGLHVLLTNQAKDLVQAFDMASRGRLPGKRKMSVRKHSGVDSTSTTRASLHSKPTLDKESDTCSSESTKPLLSSGGSEASSDGVPHKDAGDESLVTRPCHIHYRWPSCIVPCGSAAAARDTDDSSATAEDVSGVHQRSLARSSVASHMGGRSDGQTVWALGHCQSCGLHYCRRCSISLGEKDRTVDVRMGEEAGFTPQWTMDLGMVSPSKEGSSVHTRTGSRIRTKAPHDRSSLCSQSSQSSGTSTGSNTSSTSSSSISEYSVPKNCLEAFYDRPKNVHHPVAHFNRMSLAEDPQSKVDPVTPSGMRGLGPIQESAGPPACTCWKQRGSDPSQQQQLSHEVLLLGGGLLCTCWSRAARNSTDVDMPSVSSSGSSSASPSTSPKKQAPFVSVPILLPCTCGKENPYLNYAVPRSGAPVKDPKDDVNSKDSSSNAEKDPGDSKDFKTNEADDATCSMETSSDEKEDNGNVVTTSGSQKPQQPAPQVCSCQRLLFWPGSLMSTLARTGTLEDNATRGNPTDTSVSQTTAAVSDNSTTIASSDPPAAAESGGGNSAENENTAPSRKTHNLNCICRQIPWVYPVSDCCSGRLAFGVPLVNSNKPIKKDNANHIYVNLKYLQETVTADTQSGQRLGRKLIPYYANLHFIQTLPLYENAEILSIRPTNLFSSSTDFPGDALGAQEAGKLQSNATLKVCEENKKQFPKRKPDPQPQDNGNSVYEMMSFNQTEDTVLSTSDSNYLLMQPVGSEGAAPPHTAAVEASYGETQPTAAASGDQVTDVNSQHTPETGSREASILPLRPFMPVLLPFHEHTCDLKDVAGDEGGSKANFLKKCEDPDGHCRSSRSNSLGDMKMNVFMRGRSSSAEGRQGHCTVDDQAAGEEGCSNIHACSPKNTPIRKHPLLSKLTFRSKEKSFSTDEITPPSSAPSSPDSMFLESIHKYPFHRSADCLQLKEEYRLSEEDLSQDPDAVMSQSMEKGRVTISIKRSSSVPCKASTTQQHHSTSSTDSGISTSLPPLGQAAVFSHFIAYHGSLPRRCTIDTASRHPLVERKTSVSTKKNQTVTMTEHRSMADASKMIFVSECKQCHQLVTSPEGLLVLDTKSMTSSSSSDMSDYIETLSLCSRSSTSSGGSSEYIRTEELCSAIMKIPSSCTSALRPRSGKEYHSFDRVILQDGCQYIPVTDCSALTLPCLKPFVDDLSQSEEENTGAENSSASTKQMSLKMNSPSPGYVSSSPGNPDFAYSSPERATQHFVFPKETKDLNYLEVVSVGESEPTSPAVVKSGSVQYAVIDVVATAAAKKLGAERAQLREGTNSNSVGEENPSRHPPDEKPPEEKE